MARSIAVIKQQIIDAKTADSNLGDKLTSTSQTAIWNLWIYITAVAINLHEQLWDIFKKEVETIAANVVPGTAQWLRSKVLEFQFGDVLQVDNFVPHYDPVDAEARIIARCSVKQQTDRRVLVKVAKLTGSILGPLSNPELEALKAYINQIKFAGTSVGVITREADRLQVKATVYFDAQYVRDTVKANVIQAITDYLANLPFDGVVTNIKIVDAIQAVPGVKDVLIYQDWEDEDDPSIQKVGIKARKQTDPIENAVSILQSYETEAGYIIPEDEADFTFDDTIDLQPA